VQESGEAGIHTVVVKLLLMTSQRSLSSYHPASTVCSWNHTSQYKIYQHTALSMKGVHTDTVVEREAVTAGVINTCAWPVKQHKYTRSQCTPSCIANRP
jgi:hypothetical protein